MWSNVLQYPHGLVRHTIKPLRHQAHSITVVRNFRFPKLGKTLQSPVLSGGLSFLPKKKEKKEEGESLDTLTRN